MQKKSNFFFKTGVLLMVCLISLPFFSQIQALENEPLVDVESSSYPTAIKFLLNKKIIQGYSDHTFKPTQSINRAEFTKILITAVTDDFNPEFYLRNCFKDVKESAWYAPYVCFAQEKKYINGYADGMFKPAEEINLAEAAKLISNVFELKGNHTGGEWYETYLYALGEEKYIPASFHAPAQKVTRAEMAELIWRIMENKKDQFFSDPEMLLKNPCQLWDDGLPANIDMQRVRTTWLKWYNEVRSTLGKNVYIYNPQLNRTALIWSQKMRDKSVADHKRSGQTAYYDYNLITKWFANLGLVFQNIRSTTYSENIGWGYYRCDQADCTDEFLVAIRTTFDFFMSEKNKAYQPHYASIINNNFKEIGLGIALKNGKYYLTVHYGTKITSHPETICE